MWQRIKNIFHLLQAILANVWYGFPQNKLVMIGVTGTDGKTTTSSLIYHILKTSGKKAALVTSVSAIINGKSYDIGFHVTTPRFFALRSYVKKAKDLRTHYFVLEVTSHALDQNRVFGIPFAVGVVTNITHEHLDYHKTYEEYVRAKMKLLHNSKVAVVNRDDESYPLISSKFNPSTSLRVGVKSSKLITYGMGKNADINTHNSPFKTKLIGEHNRYNVLAAVAACRALGIDDKDILEAVMTFEPPVGRGEVVYHKSFSVMIDFAHTPNAIEQILSSIRPKIKGRIIHVFGSAGERDATKRPLMGEASARYADMIVLTSEDPRSEPVEEIMNQIESGIRNSKSEYRNPKQIQIFKISNRQEAINKGVSLARKGDLVLLTGKAHEKSMNYGNGEEPWDEYQAVKKALKKRS